MTEQVIISDAVSGLYQVNTGSANCCCTSPPYFRLRDYGTPLIAWPKVEYSPMAGLPPITVDEWVGELGQERSISDYIGHLVFIFRQVFRVLRDDGVLWLNLGDSYSGNGAAYGDKKSTLQGATQGGRGGRSRAKKGGLPDKNLYGAPWRAAFALQADGWILRQDVIWHKTNAMPGSQRDRCTSSHEHLFMMTKSPRYFFDQSAILEPLKESTLSDTRLFTDTISDDRRGLAYPGAPQQGSGMMKPTGIRFGGSKYGDSDEHPTKSGNEYVSTGLAIKRDVWSVATQPYSGPHFACWPMKLVEPMVLSSCPPGGVVLDPFFGTGVTGIVAKKHGRGYIGIDIDERNKALFEKRMVETLGLFSI